VPVVDSSDPFIAESVPTFDESLLVIAFKDPTGIDFPYLRAMLHDSFMSQPNTLVCPGGKMGLAMELIFTPMVWKLMEGKQRARAHETVGAL
jgi:phosphoribulokinase